MRYRQKQWKKQIPQCEIKMQLKKKDGPIYIGCSSTLSEFCSGQLPREFSAEDFYIQLAKILCREGFPDISYSLDQLLHITELPISRVQPP